VLILNSAGAWRSSPVIMRRAVRDNSGSRHEMRRIKYGLAKNWECGYEPFGDGRADKAAKRRIFAGRTERSSVVVPENRDPIRFLAVLE